MPDRHSPGTASGYVVLLLATAAGIVAYDALAAWASLQLGFPYRLALIGSCVLYAVFGFLAARRHGFGRALALGAWVGLVDASLGWAVSWWMGPSRLASGAPSLVVWASTATFVALIALVCAAAGAAIALLTQSRRVV